MKFIKECLVGSAAPPCTEEKKKRHLGEYALSRCFVTMTIAVIVDHLKLHLPKKSWSFWILILGWEMRSVTRPSYSSLKRRINERLCANRGAGINAVIKRDDGGGCPWRSKSFVRRTGRTPKKLHMQTGYDLAFAVSAADTRATPAALHLNTVSWPKPRYPLHLGPPCAGHEWRKN